MTFDDLLKGDITGIEQIAASRSEESLRMEFKRKHDPTDLSLHKDDRRAFGEALSGFANAVGGVLIIGIATDRKDGIDRAADAQWIENASQAADRYRSYANECVSPPVDGIRIEALSRADGSGVIVVDVPQGNARPHMSMAPGHQRYYRRVADGFVPMQHYEVDEMMRLKTSPKLDLLLSIQGGAIIGGNPKSYIRFGLRNTSNVTAKHPYISVRSSTHGPRLAEFGLDGSGNNLWNRLHTDVPGEATFAGGADMVIHPEQAFFVSRLEYIQREDRTGGRYWAAEKLLDGQSVRMQFTFGCEDAPARTKSAEFTKAQLINRELPFLE